MISEISKNIFTVDAFLSEQECQEYIQQAETSGFQAADVDTGSSRSVITEIRNNERVDWYSPDLAASWWMRLSEKPFPAFQIPPNDHMRAIALSPNFRFYKYKPGQKFNMHKDGRQNVNGNITLLTLLVYLNEKYKGGETKFRQDETVVIPKTGKALIFEHQLWHQGVTLVSGVKYVMRTDIVFKS